MTKGKFVGPFEDPRDHARVSILGAEDPDLFE